VDCSDDLLFGEIADYDKIIVIRKIEVVPVVVYIFDLVGVNGVFVYGLSVGV